MTIAIEHFANELKLSPTDLIQRSLTAFLERERRAVQQDIADLQDRYDVRTLSELRIKIESKKIYSHPAWEDLIEWQNLEAYAHRLDQLQAQIK
jgi:hypothetical protein